MRVHLDEEPSWCRDLRKEFEPCRVCRNEFRRNFDGASQVPGRTAFGEANGGQLRRLCGGGADVAIAFRGEKEHLPSDRHDLHFRVLARVM